jgi:DNA topoisomerase-1
VLNGRYGPYISDGKLNGRIPKDREPASLTLEEVVKLMEETGKPMRKGFGKKTAAKKTAVKKEAAPKKTTAKKAVKKVAKKATAKKAAAKKAPVRKSMAPVVEPVKSLLTPAANIELGKKRIVKATK